MADSMKKVEVFLTATQLEYLKKLGKTTGASRSTMIRMALEQQMDRMRLNGNTNVVKLLEPVS